MKSAKFEITLLLIALVAVMVGVASTINPLSSIKQSLKSFSVGSPISYPPPPSPDPYPAPYPSPVPFSLCTTVTEIPQVECEALVDLYNSTNGPYWNSWKYWNGEDSWFQTNKPSKWHGIDVLDGDVISIDLEGNSMDGVIPSSLSNLKNLSYLSLSYNNLYGTIPPELGILTNLSHLHLGQNKLSGNIPAELGNIPNLMALDLSGNQLTGTIPSELVSSSLESLRLGHNQLSGNIPPLLGDMPWLFSLDLSWNQLTGSIPPELGGLWYAHYLLLEGNQLTGSIPPEFGNLSHIWVLDLSWNQLSGSIPPELGNLGAGGVYLNNNLLSGSIPPELGNMTNLQSLSLESNKLTGEFPTSITNLTNLRDFTFDCVIMSSDPAVIAFVDALSPGWHGNICVSYVKSITRASASPTKSNSVKFTVTFSESVIDVDKNDFALVTTGSIAKAVVSAVSGKGAVRTVIVNTGIGSGTIQLNLIDNDTIKNASLAPLGGDGIVNGDFTAGDAYEIDKTKPVAVSIVRTGIENPTAASSVDFTVTFSEPVTGVNKTDFKLVTTGAIPKMKITNVIGFGATYTVTVDTGMGTGLGTIRLDLIKNSTIKDAVLNTLGNGFRTGETYTVDKPPAVISILRVGSSKTKAVSVKFKVKFSEAVTGVTANDFGFSTTGAISGMSISSITGSGAIWIVTVGTGTGSGTLGLILKDDDTIVDAMGNPLGGVGGNNGDYLLGQIYIVR